MSEQPMTVSEALGAADSCRNNLGDAVPTRGETALFTLAEAYLRATAAPGDLAALAKAVEGVESNLRTNGDNICSFSAWGMADALAPVVAALHAHSCTAAPGPDHEWVEVDGLTREPLTTEHYRHLYTAAEFATQPRIVSGDEAAGLPEGSIIAPCDEAGVPHDFDGIALILGHLDNRHLDAVREGERWRVLYLAPEPVRPLAVGDTVERIEEFDRLPQDARLVGCDADGQPQPGLRVVTPRSYVHDGSINRDEVESDLPLLILTLPEDAP